MKYLFLIILSLFFSVFTFAYECKDNTLDPIVTALIADDAFVGTPHCNFKCSNIDGQVTCKILLGNCKQELTTVKGNYEDGLFFITQITKPTCK